MKQGDQVAAAVATFGAAVKAKLTNAAAVGQPEDQLRAPLEELFRALAVAAGKPPGAVVLVGESSLADLKTRPDYSVTMGVGAVRALIGFIEVKAPDKGADPRKFRDEHDKTQWGKLKALPNLLYTDGGSFSLWRDGTLVGSVVHLEGDIETSGAKLAAPKSLLPLIVDFFDWQPIAPRSGRELAVTAARLCRFLRDEVLEQLALKNPLLTDLKDDWRALLFPDADDARFADGYAQAVTFGLLMAKSRGLSLGGGLDAVAKALGRSNTLIGTALRLLTEQESALGPSLGTLVRVLDVIDWAAIAKQGPEAWLYFYEAFLAVYDNKLRKLTGSYYTPPEVVGAMVRLCDEALRSPARFGVTAGFADARVTIADPAVGSGTFLLALLRHIAARIEATEGEGAVGPAMTEAAKRLFGFELQFGPFAVAQLRLLAEMIDLGAEGSPRLFVTDTLADPYAPQESGQGIYRELSRSRVAAAEIKRAQPITVVIGNPPYKEKAKGKGGWIEQGGGNRAAPLRDWMPPKQWGVGAHAKHLRNLYVYFWRWAAWKVFEQGASGRDLQPPQAEPLSGLVCYISVAGFLNGDGFQKMREQLRRQCDEIWVIDCSPEGHQPEVATRIFEGVQHPVCIVLASRSPAADSERPARVRFRSLSPGRREAKFEELERVALNDNGWSEGAKGWRAPFLPEMGGGWAEFVALDRLLGDSGSGVMPGRTWIIAPDAASLANRWATLIGEPDPAKRAAWFHPHEGGDRTVKKPGKALVGHHPDLSSVEKALETKGSNDEKVAATAAAALRLASPIRYGFRSFDRQLIIPDYRLINRPNPSLWEAHGPGQIVLTVPMDRTPSSGPALTATALIPDLHHYAGRGGRVFALWRDKAAAQPNVAPRALATLALLHGAVPGPTDLFTYVAALLAHPAYTARFQAELIRPGLRVPVTADAALFAEAARLGREIVWLHSFGERFADGRPPGSPRLPPDRAPTIPKDGAIPSTPEGFPEQIAYDPACRRLSIGAGWIDNVDPRAWAYEVSGKRVLAQWFSYRQKTRTRPQIGDKRPPSPLQLIQPDRWLPEYTTELLNVIHVLTLLADLEPAQADLLARVCDGPLIPAARLGGGEG